MMAFKQDKIVSSLPCPSEFLLMQLVDASECFVVGRKMKFLLMMCDVLFAFYS